MPGPLPQHAGCSTALPPACPAALGQGCAGLLCHHPPVGTHTPLLTLFQAAHRAHTLERRRQEKLELVAGFGRRLAQIAASHAGLAGCLVCRLCRCSSRSKWIHAKQCCKAAAARFGEGAIHADLQPKCGQAAGQNPAKGDANACSKKEHAGKHAIRHLTAMYVMLM